MGFYINILSKSRKHMRETYTKVTPYHLQPPSPAKKERKETETNFIIQEFITII